MAARLPARRFAAGPLAERRLGSASCDAALSEATARAPSPRPAPTASPLVAPLGGVERRRLGFPRLRRLTVAASVRSPPTTAASHRRLEVLDARGQTRRRLPALGRRRHLSRRISHSRLLSSTFRANLAAVIATFFAGLRSITHPPFGTQIDRGTVHMYGGTVHSAVQRGARNERGRHIDG